MRFILIQRMVKSMSIMVCLNILKRIWNFTTMLFMLTKRMKRILVMLRLMIGTHVMKIST